MIPSLPLGVLTQCKWGECPMILEHSPRSGLAALISDAVN